MYQDDLEPSKAGFIALLVLAARPAPIMVRSKFVVSGRDA